MIWRNFLSIFFSLLVTWAVFAEEQTVLQQLGAKTDEKGDVQLHYGSPPLKEILSAKTIKKELFGKQNDPDSSIRQPSESEPARTPIKKDGIQIPLSNHECLPDLVPVLDPTAPKPAYLKEGLSSEDVFRLLGAPSQKTFCLACPLWKYPEGLVAFTPERTVAFWQGKGFEKYLAPATRKSGPVIVAMTKEAVLSILGNPDGGLFVQNDWRYGKSHVIFSKNTGLVTHLLRFDSSLH